MIQARKSLPEERVGEGEKSSRGDPALYVLRYGQIRE
jgi:hypothetical protein